VFGGTAFRTSRCRGGAVCRFRCRALPLYAAALRCLDRNSLIFLVLGVSCQREGRGQLRCQTAFACSEVHGTRRSRAPCLKQQPRRDESWRGCLRLGLCKTHVEREASTRKSRRTCASGMCLCKMDLMSEKFRRRTVGSHVIDSPKSLGYVHVFYGPKSQKKTSDGAARIPFLGLSESSFFASELARTFFSGRPDYFGQPPLRDGFPHQSGRESTDDANQRSAAVRQFETLE
jgi:hypothetical protein